MLSESAFVIVMIMLSIASLLALLTLDISHSSTCHVSTATILTVCSVVFPPESWIPILKLLPTLEALALNLIVSLSDKSIGWPTVRVNASFNETVSCATTLREYEPCSLNKSLHSAKPGF